MAKKAKTFEEERNVAEKAPIDGIQINDLKTIDPKEEIKDSVFFIIQLKLQIFIIKILL